MNTCLLSILVCPIFVDIQLCKAKAPHLFKQLYSSEVFKVECHTFVQFLTAIVMPYIFTYPYSVKRNATHLITCYLSIFLCPIFVDVLLYKAECLSFVQAIVDFYSVLCGMLRICTLVCRISCYALHLWISLWCNAECYTFV